MSEALENAADHAFVELAAIGTITLLAEVEHGTGTRDVVVTVADDGRGDRRLPTQDTVDEDSR